MSFRMTAPSFFGRIVPSGGAVFLSSRQMRSDAGPLQLYGFLLSKNDAWMVRSGRPNFSVAREMLSTTLGVEPTYEFA
jgi:hypothetical protein